MGSARWTKKRAAEWSLVTSDEYPSGHSEIENVMTKSLLDTRRGVGRPTGVLSPTPKGPKNTFRMEERKPTTVRGIWPPRRRKCSLTQAKCSYCVSKFQLSNSH